MAQPNPAEITDALNSVLQPQGVTAKALVKEGCLHILLEGENIPEQEQYVAIVHDEILNMGIDSFPTLQIYGRQMGAKKPSWSETIDLLQGKDDEEALPNFALDDPDDDVNSYNGNDNGNDLDGAEPLDSEPDESGEKKKPDLKKLLPLLAIPLVALIGGAVWWFFLRPAPAPLLPATAPETAPESPTETPPETPPETTEPEAVPESPASVPPASTNPWRDGINLAISAAELAQTASTRAEWEEVASQWQQARDLMDQVPEDSENYGAAQERVITYGENANSAQVWADRSN